jgi:signal transduction histidine kinase/ligand-binding sensor domain-containing protein/DNA-binding response OmpR family regulator
MPPKQESPSMEKHPLLVSDLAWMVGVLLFPCVLQAQEVRPRFEEYKNVFPTCVYQDSFGFLWIGTQVGLTRYDGYGFKRYTSALDDSNAISSLWVTDIDENPHGNLWIGTYGGGLNYYDQKTDRFIHHARRNGASGGVKSNFINAVTADDDGSVWLGTGDRGVIHLTLDSGGTPLCREYDLTDPTSSTPRKGQNFVLALHKDHRGYIWVGTIRGGLTRIDPGTGAVRHFRNEPGNLLSLSHNTVSSICEDESGNLWIGTGFEAIPDGGGINMFDRSTEQFRRFTHNASDPTSLPSDRIGSLLIDRDGTLWIGTLDEGLASIPVRGLATREKAPFTSYPALREEIIVSLYEDRWGNVWVPTFGSSLYKHDSLQNPFIHYRRFAGKANSMSSTGVQSVFFDRSGNLWFGLYSTGLDKYDPRTGRFTHYRKRPDDPRSIGTDRVNGICEDDSGYIWLATNGAGLNRLDPRNGAVLRLPASRPFGGEVAADFLRHILVRRGGGFWIALQNSSLRLYDRAEGRFITIDLPAKNARTAEISSLCEDQSGALWVGTMGEGILRVQTENDRATDVKQFVRVPGEPNSLSYNGVSDIIRPRILDTNSVWIATDFGLNRLDLETSTFSHFFERDGMASDFVLKVLEDARGNIWCSTIEGICMYDVRSKRITSYGLSDGLPFIDFGGARQNAARGPDGQMVFSGASGSVGFYPERLRRNTHVPPVCIADIQVFHQSLDLDTAIQFTHQVTLSHSQNTLSFEFVALSFTQSEKNRYAYKLEGFQDEWTYCGTKRTARFTNLDPGRYVFRVKGSNNHEVWNEKGASLVITITAPWWRSGWAYAGYVLLAVGTLVGTWWLQTRRLRTRHELELRRVEAEKMRELDSMKSNFFANISHEFRTPLTLILGPVSQMLSRSPSELDRQDLGIMERSAQRLHRLINQLLDLSRIEAGRLKLHARPIDLVGYLKRVVATFESHARLRNIDLSFTAAPDRIEVFLDPEKFEDVIYNLLTNAFKYTPDGGKVEVRAAVGAYRDRRHGLSQESPCVEITVSDTGIGIPTESLDKIFLRFYRVEAPKAREVGGSGIGLALVKELVDLHHGSISVESSVGGGTTFRIRLPIGKDHLGPDEVAESEDDQDAVRGLSAEVSDIPRIGAESMRSAREAGDRQTALVLVVEDNPDMRTYLTGSLRGDYHVVDATDGEAGLQVALDRVPDLVISDVMMPQMDGFELCKRLKNDDRTSHVPVILLTARTTSRDKLEGLERGADDYLIKPFNVEELKARVGNLIAARRKLRERFSREGRFLLEGPPVVSVDEAFMRKLFEAVQQHLRDDQFGVESLAQIVGFSVSQLERKVECITGQRPNEFIRSIRLERARQLLERRAGTVSEVAFEVGFNNLSYFARSYKKKFGFSPSRTPAALRT